MITVKEDLTDYACFNLGVTLDSAVSKNIIVSVTGFPIKGNNYFDHLMYTGNGTITEITDSELQYTADMEPGNSGSPVYVTESINGYTYYTVIGINANQPTSEDEQFNCGTRITTDELNFYKNNTNLNY